MASEGRNPLGGILGTIVVVALLNGLSWLFDWGWYFW